jgi:hypothetical protein
VELDVSKIFYNPGQRTVMKALLNSLWGKLAQNENTTVVSFIDRFDELLELVNDNSIEVTSLDFISDDVAVALGAIRIINHIRIEYVIKLRENKRR